MNCVRNKLDTNKYNQDTKQRSKYAIGIFVKFKTSVKFKLRNTNKKIKMQFKQ